MTTKLNDGYLFRRRKGKYLHVDAKGEEDADIYWCGQRYGIRRAFCMFTTSKNIAEQRAAAYRGALGLGRYERFLHSLVKQGRRAERELQNLLEAKRHNKKLKK